MQVLHTHVMKIRSTGRQGSVEKGRITKRYIKLNFSASFGDKHLHKL